MRGEEIVGQRLPVRKSQDSGVAVQIEPQLGFESMRGLVVRRDHEYRGLGLLHEARDGKPAGAAVQRSPSHPRFRSWNTGGKRRNRLHGCACHRQSSWRDFVGLVSVRVDAAIRQSRWDEALPLHLSRRGSWLSRGAASRTMT